MSLSKVALNKVVQLHREAWAVNHMVVAMAGGWYRALYRRNPQNPWKYYLSDGTMAIFDDEASARRFFEQKRVQAYSR